MKNEKLRKLESELNSMKKCYSLGLFPGKEEDKYLNDIKKIEEKIKEEKKRLEFLKENNDAEDYSVPKRSLHKQVYDHQSISDIESHTNVHRSEIEMEGNYSGSTGQASLFDLDNTDKNIGNMEYEDDPYSDTNRWKRSMEINNQDSDDW